MTEKFKHFKDIKYRSMALKLLHAFNLSRRHSFTIIACISSIILSCSATWSNRNEAHNPRQSVDELIIKDQKKIEVELEIRRQVDNLMREELDLLKAVSL